MASKVVGIWMKGSPRMKMKPRKPARSPDHAASQGDDRGAPVDAPGQEVPGQALDHGPGLGPLSGRRGQQHGGQAGRGKRVQDGGAVEAGHPAVRDHHHLGRESEGGQNGSQPVAQTRLDHQPVAGVPAGEGKRDLPHYLPPQEPTGWKPVPLKKIAHHQPRYRDKGSQAGKPVIKPVLLKKISRITSPRV